jgi:uncharacterized protein with ParB-like and HNH nuclease domain/predicted transport protein
MKATEARLLAFLKKSPQFVIPIYQRTYSWTERECHQLWDDIIRAGSDEAISVHFIGSIVYIEAGLSQVSHQAPLLVIDGQQRLTTITILLAALAAALGDHEPVDGFSARKIRNYYLLNPEESGERHFKLLLSQTDKATLTALVGEHELPVEHSLRVMQNHALFMGLIEARKGDFAALCNGLAKLVVVDIALSRDQDNPQLIFESMNSTGRELSQADLIRNFILMGLEPTLQERLYEQFWRPMEVDFGQEAYNIHFDSFMRHYLTVKTGEIPRIDDVYEAFKAHARTPQIAGKGVESLVKDIRAFARYYCRMALKTETDPALKLAFDDLRELKVDVAYPFLMELYHDFVDGILGKHELLEVVRLVEAYVFRRAICAIPTNSLNKTFSTFSKALKKDRYLESVKAHFLLMPSYRRFPGDDEFKREMQVRDLYNFRSRSYWLRRFENYGRKERVPVNEYTIEHIMPQSENLSTAWRTALGEEWERIHETYLHTLGNLTLTGYNSEYSDRPFVGKRDMEGGFRESPLRVNSGLGELDTWNEDAIRERASRLAAQAVKVWGVPVVGSDVLNAYRPQPAKTAGYAIEDHPHLLSYPVRDLFDALRHEIVQLDPCVTEEFLKLYVAYKAETNFVDIVPQSKQLVLSLNIAFSEIDDPRSLCKDVSGLGRWGNGDVEVRLSDATDLPYVVGLIRQALEQQLGDGTN